MKLPIALVVALLLSSGFLLSRVRFCMVAAVGKATEGDWSGVKIIASISLAISAGLLCLGVLSGRPTMQLLGSGLVLLGGLVFGMSAAWNRGCFIGTTVQLSGGDLGALWSVAGWIVGFRILPSQGDLGVVRSMLWRETIAIICLTALLALISRIKRPELSIPIAWTACIGCGAMLAIVDSDLWAWSPSALASALAHGSLPWAGLPLILGMAIAAYRSRRFAIQPPCWSDCWRFVWGVGMAIGATLAGGGNDSQLLRFLPGGSPHAWLAVPAMAAGALVGLTLAKGGPKSEHNAH